MKRSHLELALERQLHWLRVPPAVREFYFAKPRMWRFDFAWPDIKLAVEVEGGTWSGGAHTRGKGFEEDCEKYNTAAMLGWLVLRFTSKHVKSGNASELVEKVVAHLRGEGRPLGPGAPRTSETVPSPASTKGHD